MKEKWLTPAQLEVLTYELEWLIYKVAEIMKKLPKQYNSTKDRNYLFKD